MNRPSRPIVRTFNVRTDGGIPDGDAWLSPAEQDECARWRNPQRRRDWRAGRWLLKSTIRSELAAQSSGTSPVPLSAIEVLSRDALGRGARPRACLGGRWLPWQLSLGHCDGLVCCVVAPAMDVRVGIDVVPADAPLDGDCELCFTSGERRTLRSRPQLSPQMLWALKEAIYKGTNCGEPFVPGHIEVEPQSDSLFRWSSRGRFPVGREMARISREGRWFVALALISAGPPREEHTP